MPIPRYSQCRKDFEYLQSIDDLDDWAEVQGDLHLLLQRPTKANAADFYSRMIDQWLFEHEHKRGQSLTPRMQKIKDRHWA